jgi:hypothetical protein
VHQHHGDAGLGALAEQVVRVLELAGDRDQVGDRRQRDVALAEVEADLVLAVGVLEHQPFGLDRGGVGAGSRLGQTEARHVLARGELRQVVLLLRVRAVVDEKFCGAQRVGDDHVRADHVRHRRQLAHHGAAQQHRVALAAVFLGDQQAEETLLLHEVDDVLRHAARARDGVAVDHAAQLFGGAVEEGLLLDRELVVGLAQHLAEVGVAAEELAVDPDRAGFQRLPLGVGDLRQHLVVLHPVHQHCEHFFKLLVNTDPLSPRRRGPCVRAGSSAFQGTGFRLPPE